MKSACCAIARLKDSLDLRLPDKDLLDVWLYQRMLSTGELHSGWNAREICEPKVISGTVFACAAVPFCTPYSESNRAEIEKANPFSVLGGKYLSYNQSDIKKLDELADTLDEESRKRKRNEPNLNPAIYAKLGKFDLFVPNEGKNRVDAYRRLHRNIVALVTETTFPEPETLLLHKIKPWSDIFALEYIGNNQKILKDCHSERVRILIYPESLALMRAYGVKEGKAIFSIFAPIKIRKKRIKVAHSFYTK